MHSKGEKTVTLLSGPDKEVSRVVFIISQAVPPIPE